MSLWTYDRADRLVAAKDHARGILDALKDRRCEHAQRGDHAAVLAIDARIVATDRRFRRLSRQARSERRRAALSPCTLIRS